MPFQNNPPNSLNLTIDQLVVGGFSVFRGVNGTTLVSVAADDVLVHPGVAFGVTFDVAPMVFLNCTAVGGSTAFWEFRAINITTTGFTIAGYGTEGVNDTFTNQSVDWMAVVL